MPRNVAILAYHAVAECPPEHDPYGLFVSPALFERHMDFLARHRRVVSLEDAVADPHAAGRARVAITFDDGYRSLLEHAVPALEAHGFPASVFIPTAAIGDRNRWDAPSPCGLEIMSQGDMTVAHDRGLTFESHGHEHLDFAAVDAATRRADLERSIEILESITGRRPEFFAYPYGGSTSETAASVAEAGFRAAFTLAQRHGGRYEWARVPAIRWDPWWLFRIQTRGGYPELRYSPFGRTLGATYRSLRPKRMPAGA